MQMNRSNFRYFWKEFKTTQSFRTISQFYGAVVEVIMVVALLFLVIVGFAFALVSSLCLVYFIYPHVNEDNSLSKLVHEYRDYHIYIYWAWFVLLIGGILRGSYVLLQDVRSILRKKQQEDLELNAQKFQ
jgi:NADH:ubiquinone oxidoreductase subunit 5 (subunit L)/multisubunit Na+/H+ antiporter MnhA subunit